MSSETHVILQTASMKWKDGEFPGSALKMLWNDPETGREYFLTRFPAGSYVPHHTHPGREFTYVLEGELFADGDRMGPGDFLTAGPGVVHEIRVTKPATLLIQTDRPIIFVSPETEAKEEQA